MTQDDYQMAWKRVLDIVVDAGASNEFLAAVLKSAEMASRAAVAVYQDERAHLRMCARAEFYYELADGMLRAQEASETQAKVEEAERIREQLAKL